HLAEGAVAYASADYVASAEHDRRALDEAVAADEPLLAIRAHDQLSVVAAAELDLAALRQHSRQSVAIAQRLGAPTLGGWPRGRIAIADLLAGDWDAAMRGISELDADVERLGDPRGRVSVRAMRAWVLVHRGRLTDGEALLARARGTAPPALQDDRNIFGIVALAEAQLALAQGDPQRARRDGAQLADPMSHGWLQPLGAGVLGEALVKSGELDAARRLARRARGVRSCATDGPDAIADWVEGLADAADGDEPAAAQRLWAAAEAFERLGLPFQHARARLAIASVQAGTDLSAAVAEAGEALAVFERLDAPIQAREARELLRELGVTPSRGRRSRPTSTALSARELEVSRLVASGLTNAEVATRLWISPRTVTTHLDRIYGKLGLSSRVALTRYLADSGQLDDEEATTTG
ncbi:MAG: helix-turn-helix transcriptional regulator, partial [Solirubrobacteraceae bacterium]